MARDEWFQKEIDHLIGLITEMNRTEDIEGLFECILTPREINDMAKRLKILEMLKKGKSYLEIRDTLLVSPNIVSRISNKIGYGFRRTNSSIKKTDTRSRQPKYHKPVVKYKGATPIHRIFG